MSRQAQVRAGHAGYNLALDVAAVKVINANPGIINKRLVIASVEAFLEEAWQATKAKGRLGIPHFGVLYIGRTKTRRIANPKTLEPMMLPASWKLRLRASKDRRGVGHGPS